MKKIKLTIAYDGTNYNGWQRQINGRGIESIVENACIDLFNTNIKIIGASRTDSGVHARGQVACFTVNTNIPMKKIPYAINTRLPKDIIIQSAEEVSNNFHPRYNAIKKTYQYSIYNAKFMIPNYRFYVAFEPKTINLELIKEASKYFIGQHDFLAFCSSGSSVKTTVRTIYDVNITKDSGIINISITGNGFLYNMVRIIAGTLLEVGKEKLEPSKIKNIIELKDRSLAGKTAPPQGLTLMKIYYD